MKRDYRSGKLIKIYNGYISREELIDNFDKYLYEDGREELLDNLNKYLYEDGHKYKKYMLSFDEDNTRNFSIKIIFLHNYIDEFGISKRQYLYNYLTDYNYYKINNYVIFDNPLNLDFVVCVNTDHTGFKVILTPIVDEDEY
jgi:hypothetical protein